MTTCKTEGRSGPRVPLVLLVALAVSACVDLTPPWIAEKAVESRTGGAGTGGTATGDTAKYNFEESIQSWLVPVTTQSFTSLLRSTARYFAGAASLAGTVAATAPGKYFMAAEPPSPVVPPGATVTFHVYVPQASTIDWVQPYVLEGTPGYRWTGTKVGIADLSVGAWNTITVVVPSDAVPIESLGVQFHVDAAWTGTVYVDSIDW